MTELPTTFGKYFLTDKLATGGMAEIFLAKLIGPGGFEKAMVIKQIHPALSSQRAFVDLFVAEAKTLVSLTQGNIVPVYELGVVDDTYFIAMEYIDGPTLWQLTEAVFARGDAMTPALAAYVAAEIAKGLDYAHRKGAGVIHRDLSPRNVMLTRDGEVKLVDFGIAVALGDATSADDGGLPTGSFPYMSPEQAAGTALTGQTDLFSLGVLAWEMVTGRRLFARADATETLAAVASAPIAAPRALQPGVPARLEAIVMRALTRDTAARWASAGEVSAALHRFLADETELTGARDLAALVARVCPPTIGVSAAGVDAPATHHDDSEPPHDPDAGPSTLIVPRSQPRGKRRPTVREATFATHVELERVMGPTTPVVSLRGARGSGAGSAMGSGRDTGAGAGSGSGADTGSEGDAPTGEYLPPTGLYTSPPKPLRVPRDLVAAPGALAAHTAAGSRRRRFGPIVAGGTIAVALAIVFGRALTERARTTAPIDAAAVAPPDAAAVAPPADAAVREAPVDAAPIDAPRDPSPRDARDRAPGPASDARAGASVDAAATTTAMGRLRVGANPWGEVFVDGKRLGRAPNEWTIPAGRHRVEVVFPTDDTEMRRRFDVDVPAGGVDAVLADFTTP